MGLVMMKDQCFVVNDEDDTESNQSPHTPDGRRYSINPDLLHFPKTLSKIPRNKDRLRSLYPLTPSPKHLHPLSNKNK